jgi:hypothetical protein
MEDGDSGNLLLYHIYLPSASCTLRLSIVRALSFNSQEIRPTQKINKEISKIEMQHKSHEGFWRAKRKMILLTTSSRRQQATRLLEAPLPPTTNTSWLPSL